MQTTQAHTLLELLTNNSVMVGETSNGHVLFFAADDGSELRVTIRDGKLDTVDMLEEGGVLVIYKDQYVGE